MDQQQLKVQASNPNQSPGVSTMSSSRRVSHISSIRPSVNSYEDEQYIAHPVYQRITLGSPTTVGRPITVIHPTVALGVPSIDENEAAVVVRQLQRSHAPHQYAYKAPGNIQQHSGATLRTTTMALSGHHEQGQGTPIYVHHVRQQQPKGRKQTATSISPLSPAIDYAEFDQSAFHPAQIHRPYAPQTIQYKSPAHIRSSIGSIRKTTSAFGQEALPDEPSVYVTQLRQPTPKLLSDFVQTHQHISSIRQPRTMTILPILGDTAVRVDQIHRAEIPQTIHYRPPPNIQPSIGFTKRTASALSQHEPAQEAFMNIAHLRQPIFHRFACN